MDKLIQIGVETRIHDTKISQIERQCYNGDISSERAFELVCKEIERFNKKFKSILNAPVKISKDQFMREQIFHGTTIN